MKGYWLATIGLLCLVLFFPAKMVRAEAPMALNATGPLDLTAAQALAVANSPTLAAASARVEQARQQVEQARSTYWPELEATASAARVDQSESSLASNRALSRLLSVAPSDNPDENYQLGLNASWTLFNGFQRHFANSAARFGYQQSRQANKDAQRILINAVASAYYAIQLARQQIAIARANESFNQRQMDEADARYRVGTGSLSDVLNFKVLVNSARAERIQAKNSHAVARIALAELMGIPAADFPRRLRLAPMKAVGDKTADRSEPSELIAYAHTHRPDLLALSQAFNAAHANVGVAKAPFWPTLQLAGDYSAQRSGDAEIQSDDFGNHIGLYMRYNLFRGKRDRARLAESKHRRSEIRHQLASLELTIASEVRQAATRLDTAGKQLILQRDNALLVKQNRDLVEKEYTAGQSSLVRLNEAQRNLTQAQSRLALARVTWAQAKSALESATAKNLEVLQASANQK